MLERPDFTWTDESVAALKDHWAAGLSCSQIATEMGQGLTRNSIIGKVTRLKLPKRGKVGHHTTRAQRTDARQQRADAKPAISAIRRVANENGGLSFKLAQARKDGLSVEEGMAAVLGHPRVEGLGDAVPGDRKLISLLELNERTCRWPFGDPREPAFGFCGCRKGRFAGPYCPEHTAKAENRR